jgi:hypothetical protein
LQTSIKQRQLNRQRNLTRRVYQLAQIMLLKVLVSQFAPNFLPFAERVATSPSAQTSQCTSRPLHSMFTNRGVSPPPQPKEDEQPPGVPPLSWSTDSMTNGAPDIESIEQQPTARVTLPAWAREDTVEKQRSSKKCSAVSQLRRTRAITVESMQSRSSRTRNVASQSEMRAMTVRSMQSRSSREDSTASQLMKMRATVESTQSWSSRKRSTASQSETRTMTIKSTQSRSSKKLSVMSQLMKRRVTTKSTQSTSLRKRSIVSQSERRALTVKSTQSRSSRNCSAAIQLMKTMAMTVKSTQSTTFEHVERKPKRGKVSWGEQILVRHIVNPISGISLGIGGVERKLRIRNVKGDGVASKTQESDSTPDEYQSINPLAHANQIRSDNQKMTMTPTSKPTNIPATAETTVNGHRISMFHWKGSET